MTEPEDTFQRAVAEHRAGRFAAAETAYRLLLARDETFHPAWHALGVALLQSGNSAEALNALERAVEIAPHEAKYHNNLGSTLVALGRDAEAKAAFAQSAAIAPDYAEAVYNLGVIDYRAGRLTEAEAFFRRAIEIDPTHAEALNNLGAILQERGQLLPALESFEAAVTARPSYFDAVNNVAGWHEVLGNRAEARDWLTRASALRPASALAVKRALLSPVVYRDPEDIERTRRDVEDGLARLEADPPHLDDPLHLAARGHYFLTYDGRDIRGFNERLAAFYRRACPSLNYVAPDLDRRRRGERLRIGFVSEHFHFHSVGRLYRGLIARLPRARFEVIVFVVGNSDDQMAREIRASADKVVRLPSDFAGASATLAEAKLDILHYADVGMDPMTYFLAFHRLAPVQTTSWGHPITTGLQTIDHFISWNGAELPGAQSHYSEKLQRFERMISYFERVAPVASSGRDSFGLPADRHIYLCQQTLYKIHPDMDMAFRGIVERDPAALILFIDSKTQHARDILSQRWRRQGLSEHMQLVPRMGAERYLQMLPVADVLLDSFPYSGGLTALDCFSLGLPIVTYPSEFMRGRIAGAMYRQMDVEGCTAVSLDDYAAKAVLIASNDDARHAVRQLIADRSAALFEDARVIDEFSAFYEAAAERGA